MSEASNVRVLLVEDHDMVARGLEAALGSEDDIEVVGRAASADGGVARYAQLDPDVVEQSREQYLKCALSIWSECVDDQVHRPERAVAAIDVLCVLFED